MEQTFECTKIKDGLFIGNIVAAHDYEFLMSNKFRYVINCASQIPNVFQETGDIRYLKFKLISDKPHKLWDQSLKKLYKLQKFIEQAEETSQCILVHSFHGENRSLVFIVAYLMKKFQWRLKKCLEFIKSKDVFIGLSGHYITQLQILQQILNKNNILSTVWTPPYLNLQQQIISKTFINTLQSKQSSILKGTDRVNKQQQILPIKIKSSKRVVWLDRLQRKKKKQSQEPKKIQQPQSKPKPNGVSLKDLLQKSAKQPKKPLKPGYDKNIYQLTINNYIGPSIHIINKSQPLKPPSSCQKSETDKKISRARSHKQIVKRDIKKQLQRQIEQVQKDKAKIKGNIQMVYAKVGKKGKQKEKQKVEKKVKKEK